MEQGATERLLCATLNGTELSPLGQAIRAQAVRAAARLRAPSEALLRAMGAALSSLLQSAVDAQLVLGFLANSDHVARGNRVRRDVDCFAVDADRLVRHQLTCFSASCAKTHAINDVVQTTLQQLQQVLTGSTLQTGSFLVVVAELTLENAIHTTDLLLFTQLSTDPLHAQQALDPAACPFPLCCLAFEVRWLEQSK